MTVVPGYPNDEARWGIPQNKGVSHWIYEIKDSTWIKVAARMNQYRFPETKDDYIRQHFLFAFHDDTFECLADHLTLEVVCDPYHVIFERIRRRALAGDAG